jgi:hypothetical protein
MYSANPSISFNVICGVSQGLNQYLFVLREVVVKLFEKLSSEKFFHLNFLARTYGFKKSSQCPHGETFCDRLDDLNRVSTFNHTPV